MKKTPSWLTSGKLPESIRNHPTSKDDPPTLAALIAIITLHGGTIEAEVDNRHKHKNPEQTFP